MKAWFFASGLAAVLIYTLYEYYNSRNQRYHENNHHGGGPSTYPADDFIADDFIVINKTNPDEQGLRKRRPPRIESEVCPICLEPLLKKDEVRKQCIIALPNCGHWFHQRCALRLLEYHPQCPVCRKDINRSMFGSTPVRVIGSNDETGTYNSDNPTPSTSRDTSQ